MDIEPVGRRAKNRAARYDQLLAAATEIVTEDGLDGLTMQAVADRVDCAVGTIYTYFTSKSSLMAAIMSNAVQTLMGTYHAAARRWDDVLGERDVDEAVAALTRILGFSRLFVASSRLHPREFEFLQLLISTPDTYIAPEDVDPVLPHAFAMLTETQVLIDHAVTVGALVPTADRAGDDPLRRTLRWVGGMHGAMLVSNVGARGKLPDEDAFEGGHLAHLLTEDLLLAWGAPRSSLLMAKETVIAMHERGELLPALRPADASGS
jgi:AcrR family transcriptional regulator